MIIAGQVIRASRIYSLVENYHKRLLTRTITTTHKDKSSGSKIDSDEEWLSH